jgi:hypothetical protein
MLLATDWLAGKQKNPPPLVGDGLQIFVFELFNLSSPKSVRLPCAATRRASASN